MARKTKVVQIEDEGRDKGKVFILTEVPASQAERWMTRAMLALARSGVNLNIMTAGLEGIIVAAFQALAHITFEELTPLMDEMMGCIKIRRDPNHPNMVFEILENDIEEIVTRIKLRAEVFSLHTGIPIPGTTDAAIPLPTNPGASNPPAPIVRKPKRVQQGLRRS